jgi:hypothetical protein
MNYPKYDAVTTKPDFTGFSFVSNGDKGQFPIGVQFTLFVEPSLYNLGFGLLDENGQIDDSIVLNNGDRSKILATVAGLVQIFLKQHPSVSVFFAGSTPARTRLYRRAISINYQELKEVLNIIGIADDSNNSLEPFTPGKNYLAFIVKNKF